MRSTESHALFESWSGRSNRETKNQKSKMAFLFLFLSSSYPQELENGSEIEMPFLYFDISRRANRSRKHGKKQLIKNKNKNGIFEVVFVCQKWTSIFEFWRFSKTGRHFFPCFWFPNWNEEPRKKNKNAIFVFVFDVPIGTT